MHVAGMDCADEAALIRRALNRPGITALNFDLVGRRVDVTYDPSIVPASAILAEVADTGLVAHTHDAGDVVGDDHHHHHHHHDTAKWWAAASLACFAAGWIIDGAAAETWSEALFGHSAEPGHSHQGPAVVAYALSAVTGLAPMIPRAIASLRHLHLDMHVLVCLSAIGAAAIGQWAEAAAVHSCSRWRT